MKLFLKSTGQQVFAFPWTAETARPWSHGYSRVYQPSEKHKDGTSGHFLIVKDSNLRVEK